jgi:ribosome-interacting GTPase 1
MPHQEMRRLIRRRVHGTEGAERKRILETLLAELPGYQTGPYGELRKWVHQLLAETAVRRAAKHRDEIHVPKEGCAQIVLVGPANAGKSTLLRALTGRPVAVGDYRFTTLRPAAGVVSAGGARLQLVDLPGLVAGAGQGAGGGRLLLACIRAADAILYCLPVEPAGFDEGLAVAAEVQGAGIDLPAAVLLTKADLSGAGAAAARAAAAFPGRPLATTHRDADRRPVVDLLWTLLDRIRIWPAPGGARAPEPVVLPRGATVADLVSALDGRWLERFRRARVSGPSARYAGQQVGLAHGLADGDEVDVLLRG